MIFNAIIAVILTALYYKTIQIIKNILSSNRVEC